MGWGSDPNHDPHNDFKNAVADADLSVAITVLTLFENTFYGPYDEAAWWQKVRDAAKRRRLKTGESCPIFQWVLPSIAFDRAEQHRPHAWKINRVGKPGPVQTRSAMCERTEQHKPSHKIRTLVENHSFD